MYHVHVCTGQAFGIGEKLKTFPRYHDARGYVWRNNGAYAHGLAIHDEEMNIVDHGHGWTTATSPPVIVKTPGYVNRIAIA